MCYWGSFYGQWELTSMKTWAWSKQSASQNCSSEGQQHQLLSPGLKVTPGGMSSPAYPVAQATTHGIEVLRAENRKTAVYIQMGFCQSEMDSFLWEIIVAEAEIGKTFEWWIGELEMHCGVSSFNLCNNLFIKH